MSSNRNYRSRRSFDPKFKWSKPEEQSRSSSSTRSSSSDSSSHKLRKPSASSYKRDHLDNMSSRDNPRDHSRSSNYHGHSSRNDDMRNRYDSRRSPYRGKSSYSSSRGHYRDSPPSHGRQRTPPRDQKRPYNDRTRGAERDTSSNSQVVRKNPKTFSYAEHEKKPENVEKKASPVKKAQTNSEMFVVESPRLSDAEGRRRRRDSLDLDSSSTCSSPCSTPPYDEALKALLISSDLISDNKPDSSTKESVTASSTMERKDDQPKGFNRDELKNILVDIKRTVPVESPLIRKILHPEEVMVVRRANEGLIPIFDREEIKSAMKDRARDEEFAERRVVSLAPPVPAEVDNTKLRSYGENFEVQRLKKAGSGGNLKQISLNDRWQNKSDGAASPVENNVALVARTKEKVDRHLLTEKQQTKKVVARSNVVRPKSSATYDRKEASAGSSRSNYSKYAEQRSSRPSERERSSRERYYDKPPPKKRKQDSVDRLIKFEEREAKMLDARLRFLEEREKACERELERMRTGERPDTTTHNDDRRDHSPPHMHRRDMPPPSFRKREYPPSRSDDFGLKKPYYFEHDTREDDLDMMRLAPRRGGGRGRGRGPGFKPRGRGAFNPLLARKLTNFRGRPRGRGGFRGRGRGGTPGRRSPKEWVHDMFDSSEHPDADSRPSSTT